MRNSDNQLLSTKREDSLQEIQQLAQETNAPHLKRQILKAACSLLEEELFSNEFARLGKSSP